MFVLIIIYFNQTIVVEHNLSAKCQTNTTALRFSCVKRYKNIVKVSNTNAMISYWNIKPISCFFTLISICFASIWLIASIAFLMRLISTCSNWFLSASTNKLVFILQWIIHMGYKVEILSIRDVKEKVLLLGFGKCESWLKLVINWLNESALSLIILVSLCNDTLSILSSANRCFIVFFELTSPKRVYE